MIEAFDKEFLEAVNDDLNIPRALGVTWNVVRYATKSNDLYRLLVKMDDVLGLDFANVAEKSADEAQTLDPEIEELVRRRQEARQVKNWKLADELRDKINAMGWQMEDTPQGVKISRK